MDGERLSESADFRMQLAAPKVIVSVAHALADPMLTELAVDDTAWCFWLKDWLSREPSQDRVRERRRWAGEGRALHAEMSRLQGIARGCGLASQ
jgi:hypothetical protein